MGKSFGVSSSFRDLCNLAGAGKKVPYFNFDIKTEFWRLSFVVGAIIGGFLASECLKSPEAVAISQPTINYLSNIGIEYPDADKSEQGFLPSNIFNLSSPRGIILALLGGVLIGFGTRYGKGCTSGHAISGLSDLQKPSLIAVIGFFLGGLTITHLVLPIVLKL